MRYCKSTIFQANHNKVWPCKRHCKVVCDTAKVRFFKQITTRKLGRGIFLVLFAILQKYDFSSKSQRDLAEEYTSGCCLRYCKSTIFQANHNNVKCLVELRRVVCDTAKVRFFKQITTDHSTICFNISLFAILQKYDFSSKSQLAQSLCLNHPCCLRYCKSTIFQANHNLSFRKPPLQCVVCDTAKVRFFKQITTHP